MEEDDCLFVELYDVSYVVPRRVLCEIRRNLCKFSTLTSSFFFIYRRVECWKCFERDTRVMINLLFLYISNIRNGVSKLLLSVKLWSYYNKINERNYS